jgi:hypothetical protein
VGAAVNIAATLPPQVGVPLAEAARQAFSDAFGLSVIVGAAFALIGAAMVFRFMPSREEARDEQEETQQSTVGVIAPSGASGNRK